MPLECDKINWYTDVSESTQAFDPRQPSGVAIAMMMAQMAAAAVAFKKIDADFMLACDPKCPHKHGAYALKINFLFGKTTVRCSISWILRTMCVQELSEDWRLVLDDYENLASQIRAAS